MSAFPVDTLIANSIEINSVIITELNGILEINGNEIITKDILVLTNVNTVLTISARDLLTPIKGDITVVSDIKLVYVWNGTTWVQIGDLNTSPSITVDATIIDSSLNPVSSNAVFDEFSTVNTSISNINTSLNDKESISNKNTANGYAGLGSTGLISASQIPSLALTSVQVTSTEAEQLSFVTEQGDIVIRTDESKTYVKGSGSTGTISDWIELSSSAGVLSVNGNTGSIVLTSTDITEGNNLYFTNTRAISAIGASLNDSGTTSTDLWSADFISTRTIDCGTF